MKPKGNEDVLDLESISKESQANEGMVENLLESVVECKVETDKINLDIKENISVQSKGNEGVLDLDFKESILLESPGSEGTVDTLLESAVECKNEVMLMENTEEVSLITSSVLIPGKSTLCPATFTFTTVGITMTLQDYNLEGSIVTWVLDDISDFRSWVLKGTCPEFGSAIIELDLTESGVLALQENVGPLQFATGQSCHTISIIVEDVAHAWNDVIRQISSLCDGYKSILKTANEEMIERFYMNLQNIQWSRPFPYIHEDAMENATESHGVTLDDWFDIVFPKDDIDPVTVTKYDYLLLNPDEFLSDTIVDFYIKYLQVHRIPDEKRERFYFYNSFFFRKLTDVNNKSPFERVKRWTSKVNIFDKDYLFIPVMQNAHWSLIIICNPGYLSTGHQDTKVPVNILHLDSLEGSHEGLEEPIKNYLLEAWNQKTQQHADCERMSSINFVSAKVPQQTNFSDCGLFLLHYVELFTAEVLPGHMIDFVSHGWFDPEDASRKRFKIQQIIKSLQEDALATERNCSTSNSMMHTVVDMLDESQNVDTNGQSNCGDAESDEDDCILYSDDQCHERHVTVDSLEQYSMDFQALSLGYQDRSACFSQMQSTGDMLSTFPENVNSSSIALPEVSIGHVYGSASSLLHTMIPEEDGSANPSIHLIQTGKDISGDLLGILPKADTSSPMPMGPVSSFPYSTVNAHNDLEEIGYTHSYCIESIFHQSKDGIVGNSEIEPQARWYSHSYSSHSVNELARIGSSGNFAITMMNRGMNADSLDPMMDMKEASNCSIEDRPQNAEGELNYGNHGEGLHENASSVMLLNESSYKEGNMSSSIKQGSSNDVNTRQGKVSNVWRKNKTKRKVKKAMKYHLLRQASTWRPFTRSARRTMQNRLKGRCLQLLRRTLLLN